MVSETGKSLILFDGICNLCNGFVQFIIRRDKKDRFIFSALQSDKAKEILSHYHLPINDMTTVLLISRGHIFTQSSAVLRIARQLKGGWQLFYSLIILPRFLRDFVYRLISKYRYNIFGKKDSCMVPTGELKQRFLE